MSQPNRTLRTEISRVLEKVFEVVSNNVQEISVKQHASLVAALKAHLSAYSSKMFIDAMVNAGEGQPAEISFSNLPRGDGRVANLIRKDFMKGAMYTPSDSGGWDKSAKSLGGFGYFMEDMMAEANESGRSKNEPDLLFSRVKSSLETLKQRLKNKGLEEDAKAILDAHFLGTLDEAINNMKSEMGSISRSLEWTGMVSGIELKAQNTRNSPVKVSGKNVYNVSYGDDDLPEEASLEKIAYTMLKQLFGKMSALLHIATSYNDRNSKDPVLLIHAIKLFQDIAKDKVVRHLSDRLVSISVDRDETTRRTRVRSNGSVITTEKIVLTTSINTSGLDSMVKAAFDSITQEVEYVRRTGSNTGIYRYETQLFPNTNSFFSDVSALFDLQGRNTRKPRVVVPRRRRK